MYFFDLEDYATFFTSPKFTQHFNCDGYYNGKQSWLSDDETVKIIWNNTTTPNYWSLSGSSLSTVQVINTNPASPPINGNWSVVGRPYIVTAVQGECPPPDALVMNITKNNPTCTCNGSLTVLGSGGVEPYQYSFNNGVTYSNSPFKSGLCGDLSLTVMIKDSAGTVVSQLVQMPAQEQPVTYTISRETLDNVEVTDYVIRETNKLIITPPLPPGVTINFDAVFEGLLTRTPYDNSVIGTFNSYIKKNGTTISTFTDNTTNTTRPNTNSGCQSYLIYERNYNHTYTNLQITSGDDIEFVLEYGWEMNCNYQPSTQGSVLMGEENDSTLGPLGYGRSASRSYSSCCTGGIFTHSVYVTNYTKQGCSCCTLEANFYYNRS
jgi:hypothetical protein